MAMELQEMTGMDLSQAQALLEACGGNLETALALFFDSGGATGASTSVESKSSSFVDATGVVFDRTVSSIPEAWREQDLRCIAGTMNVFQKKNGPCGVLACILAEVAVMRLEQRIQGAPTEVQDMDKEVSDAELQLAVFFILQRCIPSKDDESSCSTKGILFQNKSITRPEELSLDSLRREGAVVEIVQALVATRGEDQVRRDVQNSGGDLPLISGPHSLCSSELMSLMFRGTADGNFSAFMAAERPKEGKWANFGMLTIRGGPGNAAEVPLIRHLVFPKYPVWILHGGDHFTLLIKLKDRLFLHLNGLPPAGPSNTLLDIQFTREAEPRESSAEAASSNRYIKPIPGEVDEIIQAHPEDKKAFKDDWTKWRIEVVLAVEDDSVKDDLDEGGGDKEERLKKRRAEAHVFELRDPPKRKGDSWRCANCYRDRFRTMNFGQQQVQMDVNSSEMIKCNVCGKSLREAQWSLWFRYADLPTEVQIRVDRMFAPKLLNVVRSRWIDAQVRVLDRQSLKVVEGAKLPST